MSSATNGYKKQRILASSGPSLQAVEIHLLIRGALDDAVPPELIRRNVATDALAHPS